MPSCKVAPSGEKEATRSPMASAAARWTTLGVGGMLVHLEHAVEVVERDLGIAECVGHLRVDLGQDQAGPGGVLARSPPA